LSPPLATTVATFLPYPGGWVSAISISMARAP
jgi:hypothetical protein